MRALLVNPFNRTITEVNADFNNYKVIQSYLANGIADSDKFVCMTMGPRLNNEVHTYLDDEGYYRPNQAWFRLKNYDAPLAGYMLVLSSTEDGDERDLESYVTADNLATQITYTDEQDAAATIPPITITSFGVNGPEVVGEYPIDITDKRAI